MKKAINYIKFILIVLVGSIGCKDYNSVIPNDDFEDMFEKFWMDFDQTYSYFEIKGVDWDSVYSEYRPRIKNGETTSHELANIFGEMTVLLRDMHVSFETENVTHRYQNLSFRSNSPENAINYLSPILFNTNTVVVGDIENTSILYVRVKNLSNSSNFEPLETVIAELTEKEGIVLDLRDNGGGNDAIARGFVNKFTDKERVYELIRFRNGPGRNDFGNWIEAKIIPSDPIRFEEPIIVLTNRGVISSAESFISMMRTLPNTVLVGDTTRGSTGNPKEFQLSNGWKYRISSWQVVTPDLSFIEDHGIAPDFVVNNTEETMNNGIDLILEKAIELLN